MKPMRHARRHAWERNVMPMRGINKVILVGTLGADPELRQTHSGSSVCNMRIATNEYRRDHATQERVENTEWHSIVLFKRLAEIAEQFLNKGSQVYIEGKLRTRKWQDREGNSRCSTEVIANELQLLGPGRSARDGGARRAAGPSAENYGSRLPEGRRGGGAAAERHDDDVPF